MRARLLLMIRLSLTNSRSLVAHTPSYEKSKVDLAAGLAKLEAYLSSTKGSSNKHHMVGNGITLADIVIASTLLYPMKLLCDKAYLTPFPTVVNWFRYCVGQPEFVAVVGRVTMCQKEQLAVGQE